MKNKLILVLTVFEIIAAIMTVVLFIMMYNGVVDSKFNTFMPLAMLLIFGGSIITRASKQEKNEKGYKLVMFSLWMYVIVGVAILGASVIMLLRGLGVM